MRYCKDCEIRCKFARRQHGEGDRIGFDNLDSVIVLP